jgi:hypothetical protein
MRAVRLTTTRLIPALNAGMKQRPEAIVNHVTAHCGAELAELTSRPVDKSDVVSIKDLRGQRLGDVDARTADCRSDAELSGQFLSNLFHVLRRPDMKMRFGWEYKPRRHLNAFKRIANWFVTGSLNQGVGIPGGHSFK